MGYEEKPITPSIHYSNTPFLFAEDFLEELFLFEGHLSGFLL